MFKESYPNRNIIHCLKKLQSETLRKNNVFFLSFEVLKIYIYIYIYIKQNFRVLLIAIIFRRASSEGGVEILSFPFLKIEKNALILEEKCPEKCVVTRLYIYVIRLFKNGQYFLSFSDFADLLHRSFCSEITTKYEKLRKHGLNVRLL